AIAPGSSVKSTFSSLPTSNTMLGRSTVLKPVSSALTRYVPGGRLGALYAPASSVTRTRDVPLSTSVTVTLTPPITAPVASVTLPRIRPVLPCENTGTETRKSKTQTLPTKTTFIETSWKLIHEETQRHKVLAANYANDANGRINRFFERPFASFA